MYYYLVILAVAVERLVELAVSRRNTRWSIAHGGREFGREHYPVMVSIHALLLVSCVIEVWAVQPRFIAWLTAVVFSVANALVLSVRIRAENAALGYV